MNNVEDINLVNDALTAAVNAYDAKRCEIHKQSVDLYGMSAQNKENIKPMIMAAIRAYLAAFP